MIYGISETKISTQASTPTVNYCLIYGTSETYRSVHICVDKVNYYLDYRTSETSLTLLKLQVR